MVTVKKVIHTCCPPVFRPFLFRVENSKVGYRLAKGMFWAMAGTTISRGLTLAATILVARMLGKTSYGELGMIQTTVGLFGIFAGFGLGLTATKHVAEFRTSDPGRAGRIIGLSGLVAIVTGSIMAAALFVFAPWLAGHTINAPHLAGILRIGALILLMNALNGAQTGALSGFEAFRTIAYVNFFVGLVSFPVLVLGAYIAGLNGAVWALAFNLCINWLLNHLALRKEARRYKIPFTFRNCRRELPVLWRFSLPAVLSGILVGPVVWVCNTILVHQENGYAALGIYSAAFQLSAIIATLNVTLGQAFLPVCVTLLGKNDLTFDFLNFAMPWGIGIFCALPFLCIPELWAALLGNGYAGQSIIRTVAFVAISALIIAHRQGIARNFIAGSTMWWSLLGNSFWGITSIICTYLLRGYGAEGRAASFMIAYILNTIVFVPIYIRLKLCPEHLLLSRYSIFIGGVLVLLAGMTILLSLGVYVRFVIMLLAYFLIFLSFQQLWIVSVSGLKGKTANGG